jgi:hypothetical protein
MSARILVHLLLGTISALAVIGCQSSPAVVAKTPPPERALVVNGGNAGSVTVYVPSADKTHADILYSSSGGEGCPACR